MSEHERVGLVVKRTSADDAHSVDTVVTAEQGRWAVDIIVVFDDGVVRKRIQTYPTARRAEIAADLIKRAADRDPAARSGRYRAPHDC